MKIEFSIRRQLKENQKIYIIGSSPILGEYDPQRALPLQKESEVNHSESDDKNSDTWSANINIDGLRERIIFYKYFIKDESENFIFEAGGGRRVALNSATTKIVSIDSWQENDQKAPFLTDPFAHVFYGASYSPYTQTHINNNELIIRAVIPNIPKDCHIVLYHDSASGNGIDFSKSHKMARLKGLKWIASINVADFIGKRLKYSFALINDNSGEIIKEYPVDKSGDLYKTREIEIGNIAKHETVIIEHTDIDFGTLQTPKFAGVTVPVFALRTEDSCGIGDIGDIKKLIDWAERCSLKVINILPINDTTRFFNGKDSSPYNCISSVGLNPIYLSLRQLGEISDRSFKKEAEREIRSLNYRASVDWEDVYAFKFKYLKKIYEQNREDFFAQPQYYKFLKTHKEWLLPYAAFCSLRDYFRSADFSTWKEFAHYSKENINILTSEIAYNGKHDIERLREGVKFYIFLQYALFFQMNDVIDYAHSKGIAIKGEYPMNVSQDSVDAWIYPEYFNFSSDTQSGKRENLAKYKSIIRASQTGASAPIFNWENMQRDNFLWWKKRVRAITEFLDIYSIGRIGEQSGVADNAYIVKLLPQLLSASNMLVCGKYTSQTVSDELSKDSQILMQSHSIMEKMKELEILSLELPVGEDLSDLSYFSVISTSTCNSKTLRMWLGERLKSETFHSEDTEEIYYDATPTECEDIICKTLSSNSMFAIIPIQDWMSINERIRSRFPYSERINDTAINGGVWRYRMHIPIEQLIKADALNNKIKQLIQDSERG